MARSPEYKAFKRSYSFLRNTLTANDVAPVASSNGLLTKTERQAALHSRYEDCEKNDKLLEAIEKRILANPENFHKFVQLLEDELEEFLDAAQKLRATFQEMCGNPRPVTAPPSITRPPPPPPSSAAVTHEISFGAGLIAQATPSLPPQYPPPQPTSGAGAISQPNLPPYHPPPQPGSGAGVTPQPHHPCSGGGVTPQPYHPPSQPSSGGQVTLQPYHPPPQPSSGGGVILQPYHPPSQPSSGGQVTPQPHHPPSQPSSGAGVTPQPYPPPSQPSSGGGVTPQTYHPPPPPSSGAGPIPQPMASLSPTFIPVQPSETNERSQVASLQAPTQESAGQETQSSFQETGPPVQETQPPANGAIAVRNRDWFQHDGVEEKLVVEGDELDVTRYAAFDESKRKSIVLSFGEVKIKRKKKHEHSPYPMKRFPHGVVVIINNERFATANLKVRIGTAVDEENLVQTFRNLCYNVEVYRNCTSAQIMEVLGDMQRRDHSNFDSFVCCILSHGEEGKVFGSDGRPVVLTEVTALLNARNCKSLASKPKMFFIQACRGSIEDPAAQVQTDSPYVPSQKVNVDGGSGQPMNVPNESDFLFSYATPLGHVAIRHEDYGSWYVSELCQVLCESSRYLHLDDMLKDVHRNVAQNAYHKPSKSNPDEEVEYRQAGEETHRLHRNIYFF